jgi:hypothetical protein
MSKAVNLNDIVDNALQGVKNAFNNYRNWSGGYWLGNAPESFIQSEIAKSLSKICPYVTLEDNVRDHLKNAGASIAGNFPRKSKKGRIDIVVWWEDETPRILIEVKSKGVWANRSIKNDTQRLKQLLGRGGSQQTAFLIVYAAARNQYTITNRFKKIAEITSTELKKYYNPFRRHEDDGIWYWSAACFRV